MQLVQPPLAPRPKKGRLLKTWSSDLFEPRPPEEHVEEEQRDGDVVEEIVVGVAQASLDEDTGEVVSTAVEVTDEDRSGTPAPRPASNASGEVGVFWLYYT